VSGVEHAPAVAVGRHGPNVAVYVALVRSMSSGLGSKRLVDVDHPKDVVPVYTQGHDVLLHADQRHAAEFQALHRAGQHPHRPRQDLLGGLVVDAESVAASAHADPEARQGYPVLVDPLVRVADDEQVVRPWGDRAPARNPSGAAGEAQMDSALLDAVRLTTA
jgi:hypothetical protein